MKGNIILIGFMGSGKTTVGKALAEKLSYKFVDTDEWIEEKEKRTISDIFNEEGEAYFRTLETDTIINMGDLENHVISTGGGLPLKQENGEILKKIGFIVYLDVTKETVMKRLEGDRTRPLLSGSEMEQSVKERLQFRKPIYEYTAHITISADDKEVDDIVEEIKRNYEIVMKCKKEK